MRAEKLPAEAAASEDETEASSPAHDSDDEQGALPQQRQEWGNPVTPPDQRDWTPSDRSEFKHDEGDLLPENWDEESDERGDDEGEDAEGENNEDETKENEDDEDDPSQSQARQ